MFFIFCEYVKFNFNFFRSVFLGYLISFYYYMLLDVFGFIRFLLFFLYFVKVGEYMVKEIVILKYRVFMYIFIE